MRSSLESGVFAMHTSPPNWMWNAEVQVVEVIGGYVIGDCRQNHRKGWANTLAIFNADDLDATTRRQRTNPEFDKPGAFGLDWIEQLRERIAQLP